MGVLRIRLDSYASATSTDILRLIWVYQTSAPGIPWLLPMHVLQLYATTDMFSTAAYTADPVLYCSVDQKHTVPYTRRWENKKCA